MSGLVKPKQYDWKDSNMALFGSETEKKIKQASAATEEAWQGAGQKVGLQIWRINQFKVEHWPKEDYGKFFSGDSYIVMNTYKNEGEEDFEYDIHFWIGEESSQDEYGTAAYKTVELDTLLEDKPVQHREVMENESDMFKEYFSSLTYLKGGAQSGFKHVEKKEIKPRLFHFKSSKKQGSRKKEIKMREIGLNVSNLDSGDVYILETEEVIYQWNGSGSDQTERFAAGQYVLQLREDRLGKIKCEVIEDPDIDEDFMSFFSDRNQVEEKFATKEHETHVVKRLTDATGQLQLIDVPVSDDKVTKAIMDSNDVFIVDKRNGACYVWFGKRASAGERKNWSIHAHNYLKSSPNPLKHVQTVKEGQEPAGFFD